MADVASSSRYSELTAYSGRYRVLGLNNDVFNTNDLLEAEIAAIEGEITPTENKKANLEKELAIWKEYSTKISSFSNGMKGIKNSEFNSRVTSYSSEGSFTLAPSANAVEGKYNIEVIHLAQNHQISSDKISDIETGLGQDDVITINGKELEVKGEMSLRDIVGEINGGSYGVSASIISNRLVLTSKESGTENAVKLEDGTNGFLKNLGVLTDGGGNKNTLVEAKNAEYSINGIKGESQNNTIKDGLDGSVLTLQRVTGMPVTAEIKSDENKMVDKVKEFVELFNATLDNHNYYSGEGMMLQGQSTALNIRTALSEIGSFAGQDGTKLYEVGVSLNKNGKLVLDEGKLKDVYKNNPDKVQNAMFGDNGVAAYMEGKMARFVGSESSDGKNKIVGTLEQKINGMDDNVSKLAKEIQKFDDMYKYRTDALYEKYSEFESKMANLNFQLTYMEAQIKALNGNKD